MTQLESERITIARTTLPSSMSLIDFKIALLYMILKPHIRQRTTSKTLHHSTTPGRIKVTPRWKVSKITHLLMAAVTKRRCKCRLISYSQCTSKCCQISNMRTFKKAQVVYMNLRPPISCTKTRRLLLSRCRGDS